MPELPEVQTVVEDLRPALYGRRLCAQSGLPKHRMFRYWRGDDILQEFDSKFDTKVESVNREGKYILLRFAGRDTGLAVHLGMTGQLYTVPLEDYVEKNHEHFRMLVKDGDKSESYLIWRCPRRFGIIFDFDWSKFREHPRFKYMGPDALEISFDQFTQVCKKSRHSIKSTLLDQTAIAGIGNIYACESLFHSGIHPATPAKALDEDDVYKLFEVFKTILEDAIDKRGSSVSDYVDGKGQKGSFQNFHAVYGRKGKPCKSCETPILRQEFDDGRSSFFCQNCQMEIV